MTPHGLTPSELRRLEGEAEKMVGERKAWRDIEVSENLAIGRDGEGFYIVADDGRVGYAGKCRASASDLKALRDAITELLGEEK